MPPLLLELLPVLPTLLTLLVDIRNGSAGDSAPVPDTLSPLLLFLCRGGVEVGPPGAGGGIEICPAGGGGTSEGKFVLAADVGLHAMPPMPMPLRSADLGDDFPPPYEPVILLTWGGTPPIAPKLLRLPLVGECKLPLIGEPRLAPGDLPDLFLLGDLSLDS